MFRAFQSGAPAGTPGLPSLSGVAMQAQSVTQSERSAGRLFAAIAGVLFLVLAVLHAIAG